MTSEILLTVPARHLTTGDHTAGFVVSQIHRFPDGSSEFKLVVPRTVHSITVLVQARDLDGVSFPLTARGDAHSPSERNKALGLPEGLHRPVYKATPAEPIAVYPAGTLLKDVKHFDRGQHIQFRCPLHPEARYSSKDPFVSSWFSAPFEEAHDSCPAGVGDYVVTAEYLPTRNG